MPSWWFAEEQLFAIVVVVRGLNLNLNLNIFSGADQIFEMLIEQTGGSCQLFKDGGRHLKFEWIHRQYGTDERKGR